VTQGGGHQDQPAGGGQDQGAEQHRGAGQRYVAEPVLIELTLIKN
jgi:hypothetical protein